MTDDTRRQPADEVGESVSNNGDSQIGYGSPPEHSRFKKGKSGNPKGRPRGRRNIRTDVLEMLNAPFQFTENGRIKKVSTQRFALLRLREKVGKSDSRAIDRVIDLAAEFNGEELAAAVAEFGPGDQAILAAYDERIRRRTLADAASDGTDQTEVVEKLNDSVQMDNDDVQR